MDSYEARSLAILNVNSILVISQSIFLDWFQIDSKQTRLIQTIVLIVQFWIDFGSILIEVLI